MARAGLTLHLYLLSMGGYSDLSVLLVDGKGRGRCLPLRGYFSLREQRKYLLPFLTQ